MTPYDLHHIVEVIRKYDNHYTFLCLQYLNSSFHIPLSSMHNIHVCVLVAKEHPEIGEFGHGASVMSAYTAVGDYAASDIEAADANIDINKYLDSFQIVPKLMTGSTSTNTDVFAHIILHRNINGNSSY